MIWLNEKVSSSSQIKKPYWFLDVCFSHFSFEFVLIFLCLPIKKCNNWLQWKLQFWLKEKNANCIKSFFKWILVRILFMGSLWDRFSISKWNFHHEIELGNEILSNMSMYNYHPRDSKLAAIVDRWSLFRGTLIL